MLNFLRYISRMAYNLNYALTSLRQKEKSLLFESFDLCQLIINKQNDFVYHIYHVYVETIKAIT